MTGAGERYSCGGKHQDNWRRLTRSRQAPQEWYQNIEQMYQTTSGGLGHETRVRGAHRCEGLVNLRWVNKQEVRRNTHSWPLHAWQVAVECCSTNDLSHLMFSCPLTCLYKGTWFVLLPRQGVQLIPSHFQGFLANYNYLTSVSASPRTHIVSG